jgi:predicted transcriptional regulator
MPPDGDLSDGELEVLSALWDLGPAPVRAVMNRLHQRDRRLAYTTVLTFLNRLEQKGYVRSDRSGMAYVYRPAVTRARVRRSRLRVLLEQLYDGAAGALALQLVEQGSLTDAEIAQLQKRIEELDARRRRPTRDGRQ